MIYALIDNQGFIQSFRPEEIYGSRIDNQGNANPDIPNDAVEVDIATWQEWLSFPALRRWDRNSGTLIEIIPPVPTLDDLRAEARSLAATKRYAREIAGVHYNNYFLDTDRDAQGKLSAVYQAARDGYRPNDAVWKFKDGTIAPVTNSDMIEIAKAVLVYVQSCFEEEARIVDDINKAESMDALKSIILTLRESD